MWDFSLIWYQLNSIFLSHRKIFFVAKLQNCKYIELFMLNLIWSKLHNILRHLPSLPATVFIGYPLCLYRLPPLSSSVTSSVFIGYPLCLHRLPPLSSSVIPLVFIGYPLCLHRLPTLSLSVTPFVFIGYPLCLHRLPPLFSSVTPSVFIGYPSADVSTFNQALI